MINPESSEKDSTGKISSPKAAKHWDREAVKSLQVFRCRCSPWGCGLVVPWQC